MAKLLKSRVCIRVRVERVRVRVRALYKRTFTRQFLCVYVYMYSLSHSQMTKFWTKLKAFADDKLDVTKMIISVYDKVENSVGKGEIACTSNFSFSNNVFKKILSQTRQKVSLQGNGLRSHISYQVIIQIQVGFALTLPFADMNLFRGVYGKIILHIRAV